MSERIRVPVSELRPDPATGRIRVPVSELKPTHKEGLLSKAIRWLTPIDELADPKKAIDSGALETLGGVAGGLAGGIPGAMGGAAVVRGVRGIVQGEKPAEIALNSAGHASLEALPLVGRGIARAGKNIVRGILPVAEKELQQVGKGSLREGLEAITQNAIDAPGSTLTGTLDRIGSQPRAGHAGSGRMGELARERSRLIAGATEAGVDIPTQPVLQAGDALVRPGGAIHDTIGPSALDSGAQGVIDRFRSRVTNTRLMTDDEFRAAMRERGAQLARGQNPPNINPVMETQRNLSPAEADAILRQSKFFKGGKDIPGAETAGRELRTELSRQLKGSVDGLSDVMSEQEKLIPLRRVLDRASVYKSNTLRPEAVVSGAKSPRLLGVVPLHRGGVFTIGKATARTGRALDTPALSPATRTLLMQLLMEQDSPSGAGSR